MNQTIQTLLGVACLLAARELVANGPAIFDWLSGKIRGAVDPALSFLPATRDLVDEGIEDLDDGVKASLVKAGPDLSSGSLAKIPGDVAQGVLASWTPAKRDSMEAKLGLSAGELLGWAIRKASGTVHEEAPRAIQTLADGQKLVKPVAA